jgi:predicted molibdopterin-dependent oxidoreductase YjgC
VSGDEAALDPAVRDLAGHAEHVIGIGMFEESFRGLCDLVLPGTSYLERDGTTVNLEGRLQRQRRAVIAPCPDELAWIAKLAERFEVELSPHASTVFGEISQRCYGGIVFGDVPERAPLPKPVPAAEPLSNPRAEKLPAGDGLRLLTYRPLFSGPAVDRTPELQFQRPGGEIELARADARSRGIANGAAVTVSSNGTSRELRARIARDLPPGYARVPRTEAEGLHDFVEVTA